MAPKPDSPRAAMSRWGNGRGKELQNDVVPGLIDPDRVPDVFAEGVASIEMIGATCLRWTLYATHHFGADVEHIVVARIVMPAHMVPTAIKQTTAVLSGQPFIHSVPISAFLS